MAPNFAEYFSIASAKRKDKHTNLHEDFLYCNLYACLLNTNGMSLDTCKRIEHFVEEDTPVDTIVTHSGDFGIKKMARSRGRVVSGYELSGEMRGGYFLPVDIESVLEKYNHWFTTNLREKFHNSIYPIPLGIHKPDFEKDHMPSLSELRQVEKHNRGQYGSCYANFTITSNYRITIAEWAAKQPFIDWLFPKRHEKQDEELRMSVLADEGLPLDEFLRTLASYRFALCPNGNGLDTFRMWECILVNTVPIAQDNYANRIFSKIWPMILVGRYEQCDLPQKMAEFSGQYGEQIQYDHDLLLQKNMPELMERIKYECNRS